MPYDSLKDVPDSMKTHKDIALTLPQVNKLAEIYDAVKENPDVDEPMAVAWSQWEDLYEIKDGAWVAKESRKHERKPVGFHFDRKKYGLKDISKFVESHTGLAGHIVEKRDGQRYFSVSVDHFCLATAIFSKNFLSNTSFTPFKNLTF